MNVEVVAHDPNWKTMYESESRKLCDVLGDCCVAVHHIGSTAIPTILAKPIIDILIEVTNLDLLDECVPRIESLGYESLGEFGIPRRRYFRKDNDQHVRSHQIHAFEAGTEQIIRHLGFRDYLILHHQRAIQYSELKRRLAEKFPFDKDSYINGKDEFIKETDRLSLEWQKNDCTG